MQRPSDNTSCFFRPSKVKDTGCVLSLIHILLLFVRIPEPSAAATTEPISTLMKGALKFRHFVLGAIAIFVYVGIEVGVPGTLNLFLTDPVEKGGAGIASTISGFVVGTYWFLMLIGRLAGASLGAKVSSKAMLTFTSALGLILVFLAIFSSTGTLVNLPVPVSYTHLDVYKRQIPLYLGCNSLDNIFAAAFQPFFIVRLCCIHFRYLRSNRNRSILTINLLNILHPSYPTVLHVR